ncbi:auxin response factor 1-like [Nicotiana tomentosiformis]|uniref:auxin response factor 1-like n=1 Tax=Nicotiana tomentosiformis TaxID=4098 RepID=UPI00388C5BEF
MDGGIGSSHHQQQDHVLVEGDYMYRELWKACADPMMDLPKLGERVYYFPMTHMELLKESADQIVPSFDLPTDILCRVINIQLKVEPDTDEVYAHITLLPEENQSDQTTPDAWSPQPFNLQFQSFCKVLTASDTNSNWGLTVRREDAIKCFPPLDITKQKPIQELIVKDLNGSEWRFCHVFRGQPRRHLLTKGWSKFVASKKLVTGDSVIFLRGGNGELCVGVRRQAHGRHNIGSSPVSSQTVQGVLAVVSHAFATGSLFSVYYQPRKSRFILSLNKYLEPNRAKPSNQNSAQIASNGLCTNQASVDDLDCDVFSDIFLAAHPLFLENTPEPNGNCVGVASTVQNFEGWPESQRESFTTYPQQPIPEPSVSTSTLQPTDTLQVMCTYSTPRQLPTEGPGCGNEQVSWAGYQVAQRYVPILSRVIMRYPSTISGFKAITGALQSVYLEMLAKLVDLLEKSRIGSMDNRNQFQVIKQYLVDLKFIGIDISWIETRLAQIDGVLKMEKLIQHQHALAHRIDETQLTLGLLNQELGSVRKELEELTPKVGPTPPSKDCSILEGLL